MLVGFEITMTPNRTPIFRKEASSASGTNDARGRAPPKAGCDVSQKSIRMKPGRIHIAGIVMGTQLSAFSTTFTCIPSVTSILSVKTYAKQFLHRSSAPRRVAQLFI